jgi:hypothetical protein
LIWANATGEEQATKHAERSGTVVAQARHKMIEDETGCFETIPAPAAGEGCGDWREFPNVEDAGRVL